MDLLSHIQYMWNSICILHIHLYYLYNTHIIAIKFSLGELKIWQYIETMRGSHRNTDCIKNPIPCIYMLLWMHSLTYKWELNFLYTDTTCIFFKFQYLRSKFRISSQDLFPKIKCYISWNAIYIFVKAVIWNEDKPHTKFII